MIEIIAISLLGGYVYRLTKACGLPPWKYVVITVVLWVGCELLGAFIGVMVTGDRLRAYPFALFGSVIGGYIGYLIAKKAAEQAQED